MKTKLQAFGASSLFLPLMCGVLMALCYPMVLFTQLPINSSPLFALLAFVTPAMFFFSLESTSRQRRFIKGFIFAFTWYSLVLYWVTHSMIYYGNISYSVSILILIILVSYLSLYPAIWAWLYDRFGTGWRRVVLGSAVWVLLEFISTYFLTGFPWCLMGYSIGNVTPLIQPADLCGIHGLSFLVVAMNLLLLECRDQGCRNRRITYVALLLAWLIYGSLTLHAAKKLTEQPLASPRVTLIQGNISQDQKWAAKSRQFILDTYLQMTAEAMSSSDLIVWPEASYPYSIDYSSKQLPFIDRLRRTDAQQPTLMIGVPTHIPATSEIMNSLMNVNSDGQILQRYDKIHLVLYGEFIPFADFLPIKKLTQGLGNFTSGQTIVPVTLNTLLNGTKMQVGPLICYEVIYPDLARDYASSGSGLLINITNDAWFGITSGPFQHLNIARFRAVENRLALARAANTGISAFISPSGEIYQNSQLAQRLSLQQPLPYLKSSTLYCRFGDWPLLTLMLLALVLLPLPKK